MKLKIKTFVFFVLTCNLIFAQIDVEANKNWFSGITSQLIIVTLLISLIFSFLTLFLASKLFRDKNGEVSKSIKNYVKSEIDGANWNKNTTYNISKSDLQDIYQRITDLDKQIEQIKKQLNTSNSVASSAKQSTQQNTHGVKPPEVRQEIFFLSSPNSDGSFDESSASSIYKEGATIYRFTKIENNKANFKIDEKEASIKLALQYRDKRIDPVCDALNAFNPRAARIITEQQGEAELQNGKWTINNKAKIRYEN